MAKFNTPDPNDDQAPIKPAMDEVYAVNNPGAPPPPPIRPGITVTAPPITPQPTTTNFVSGQTNVFQTANSQASATVGLAQIELETKLAESQLEKQNEHWVKTYWRPAMGWLYMIICFTDFVVFPAIAMFLPVIMKGFGIQMQYTAWQSLTLSNGGMMHLAFGAILGVSAWTRGQEKISSIR